MVDLFLNRVLVENNWDQDELNTEREIVAILENRIVLLLFATAESEKCQEFLPILNDFFKRLKDPAYIEYPKLFALIFVSLDQSEEQQDRVLKEMHKRVLFLAFEDPYRNAGARVHHQVASNHVTCLKVCCYQTTENTKRSRKQDFFRIIDKMELQAMFKVKDVPTVVVLRPDCSVLSPNAVQEICCFGLDCFRNWQESAEVVERTFMFNEEFENLNMRSATEPVRRLKYKTEDDKRKTRWWKPWGKGKDCYEEEEEKEGAWDTKRKEGDKGTWWKR